MTSGNQARIVEDCGCAFCDQHRIQAKTTIQAIAELRNRRERAEVEIAALRDERAQARHHARVLAHAWQHDVRPPHDVVQAALAYAVDQQ